MGFNKNKAERTKKRFFLIFCSDFQSVSMAVNVMETVVVCA